MNQVSKHFGHFSLNKFLRQVNHIYLLFHFLLSKVFEVISLIIFIHIAEERFSLSGYLSLPFAFSTNSRTLPLTFFLLLDFFKPRWWRCRFGSRGWTPLKPLGIGNVCLSFSLFLKHFLEGVHDLMCSDHGLMFLT